MHPVLLEVFGLQIASYGTCMALGAAAAWFLARALAGRGGYAICSAQDVAYAYLICLCGGLSGAFLLRPLTRLPEIFVYWESFRHMSAGVVMGYLFGEMVFYGGLIGGAAALFVFCGRLKIPVQPLADLFAPATALAHAFGRVGCFLGGCCYGVETGAGHPFAVRFPVTTAGGAPPGVPLLATQLIEASCLLLICAVLCFVYLRVYKKTADCTEPVAGNIPVARVADSTIPVAGNVPVVTCLYGVLYGAMRFVLEFYRGDPIRGVYGPFSTSQYISIIMFCASVALPAVKCYKSRSSAA